jgi:hypothetical protein
MASNIDIYLDLQGGGIQIGGSAVGGQLPTFTRSDVYTFRLRLQKSGVDAFPIDVDTTGTTLKLGIGNIDDVPTDGQFKLTCNGTTSSAITFSSTAVQIYTALSNNVSTVATYGNEEYSYVLTATQPNTAMSFGGDSFTLFPSSSILINTRRNPTTGIRAQQVVKLRRNPAIFSDSFVASPTAGVAVLSKTQDGSATQNETYRLSFGSDASGGSFVLNYGTNSTTAIVLGATAVCAQEALSSVTGIGNGNISVSTLSGENGYSISFVRELGSSNLTTALVLDSSGLYYSPFRESTVTFATAELDELFAEEGTDTITPSIEIEITDGGNPKTLYQGNVTIRKDLISSGSAIPAARESYYTKAEANSLFVEDSNTNVDATNRKLYNSSSQVFLDWQNNTIGTGATILDLSGTAVTITDGYNLGVGTTTGTKIGVSTSSKLAFFGSTAITQPSGINIVSGLTNLGLLSYTQPTAVNVVSSLINTGLIRSGTTYGVLPLSPRTLTTTASIYFGIVGNNSTNSVSVVVTGCQVNDIVLLGLPTSNPQGVSFLGHVTTTNGLEVDCINATNGSLTPATATYRITVIGY